MRVKQYAEPERQLTPKEVVVIAGIQVRRCMQDADYARFTRFYLNNSKELNEDYMLDEALLHLIQTLPDTLIMLVENDLGELIAFIQYQYGKHPDSGEMLLTIEAAILASAYRKSRVFYEGFRSILQHILKENPEVKHVQFYALADHRYLNRLYSKFAKRSGVRQSSQRNAEENRYIQNIGQLMKYLRL